MKKKVDKSVEESIPTRPLARKEPLPWQAPKAREDDPGARERQEAIMASPGYLQADEDMEFLGRSDTTRGVRLQLDYLKAESLLEQHGIQHTIVVFGSTRIHEPATIKRDLAQIRTQLEETPENPALQRRLAVLERLLAKSHYYSVAGEFGEIVGRAGNGPADNRVMLVTGGGPGIMEASNRGAFDAGAKSLGLNITLPHEQYPNPYITPELCFRFHYFAIRKLHFLLRARALVAFPGGFGTFDELFETLTLIQTRKINPLPVVLVGEEFWRGAFDVDFLAAEGVIDPEDKELFWFAETADEIWQGLNHWYESGGEPFLPALD
ncbi:MAG TPA: LOG family protein [Thermodesulfobacteriaceae bacterium]|nr:LOG family protein [Thermodesulfobacteriaceae bacterium]